MWKHAACIQYLQKDKAFARYGATGKTSCRRSEKTKLNDNSKMPLLVRGWLLVQVLTILHSNQRNTVHGGISKSFLFVLMSRFLWAIPIQSAFTLKKVIRQDQTIFKHRRTRCIDNEIWFSYAKWDVFKAFWASYLLRYSSTTHKSKEFGQIQTLLFANSIYLKQT